MKNLTKEQILDIPVLKDSGMTSRQIAIKYETGIETIRRWARVLRGKGYTVKQDKTKTSIL